MEHVYSSVDIGSDSIKIVVCELCRNRLNLLAATSVESKGIKKDLITNPNAVIESIKNALQEVEDMLGVKINKAIASIPSFQIEYKIIKGETEVIDDTISYEDISNVYKQGIKSGLPANMEFVNLVPIDFKINDRTIMKDPKGFPGSKLFGRAMMISSPQKNVYSVASVLESIGVEIADISVTSIGDIYAFKNKDIDEKIGAIINIGSDITTVSLYNKAIPVNTKIVNMGSEDIDNDIAYMYNIEPEEAKKIKEKFALADKKYANKKDTYETINNDSIKIKINQLEVSEIVMARIEEIFSLAKNELKLLTNREIQYIIITGGGSNALNIEDTAQNIFGVNSFVGKIKMVGVRNNKYSTALGNLIYFINNLKLKGEDYTMLSDDDMEMISSPNKHFINTSNDTMLGKVFGYFFGE
ncbi:MAG: cell division protein FtsA [Bacilli bacterium]|nr:cell division protein FtsA [Bacilli bacterium]